MSIVQIIHNRSLAGKQRTMIGLLAGKQRTTIGLWWEDKEQY
jgi:hypothetical protein